MADFNATKYANDYIAKNYDRLSLAFPGGSKAAFQAHVDEHRDKYKSITDFLYQAARAQIDRDNGTDAAPSAPSPASETKQKPETLEDFISRRRAEAAEEREKANGPSELMKEAVETAKKRAEATDVAGRRKKARAGLAEFFEAKAQEKPAVETPDVGAMMEGLSATLAERAQAEEAEEDAE